MKKQKRFYDKMVKGLLEIGAVEQESIYDYPYTLATKYGNLYISISGNSPSDAKSSVYTCFTRFDNVNEAKEHVNCNPHTGKWNFHVLVEDDIPERVADSFVRHIKNII